MASYPDATRAFVHRQDFVDIQAAGDINDLQDEVRAVQATVGRNPHLTGEYPSSATVADRLTFIEQDFRPRTASLESRMRRAAVSVNRTSTLQINSSDAWQPVTLPDVVTSLNDFGGTLYATTTGRFFSVAPAPGIWTLTASVTWFAQTGATGVRGVGIRTQGGTLLAVDQRAALENMDQPLTVNWTGRLTADPNFYLELVVRQNQGTAVFLRGDSATTPMRADFTHIPG